MDLPFATLTPMNVLAKMAFSDVFDDIMRVDPADHRMSIEPEQKYHGDVLRFRLTQKTNRGEGDFSESPTEPDTDTEFENRHIGMIWTGRYVFGFQPPPSAPDMGWVAGKGSVEKVDVFLCTRAFAKRHNLNLRSFHARFNFDPQNGAIFIAKITSSPLAGLTVNGEAVGRQMHVLNQHSMKIWVDSMEYIFEYTNFASTKGFMEKRKAYLTNTLKAQPSIVFDMPTPSRNTMMIGQWTLGNPLGKGSTGRVFLASNWKNQVVAVKIMERNSKSKGSVDKEIAACRDLTTLAEKHNGGERIVRLKETIYPREEASSPSTTFEDIALVLEPMAPQILDDLVESRSRGGPLGMSIEAAAIFRDALLGLKFLHENGWLHRDMKPQNIGVLPGSPPRAVLLDVGQAMVLDLGSTLPATPGWGGTINYLAPEREMSEYDHAVDVWPMGVIGYELTYGHHPFKFAANPWRPGEHHEQMRPAFHQRYQQAIDKMSVDQKAANKDPCFIHLGDLLVQILRHPWAPRNCTRRVNVNEALQHPAWGPLLSNDDPQAKRVKFDERARR